mgnify:FL=1
MPKIIHNLPITGIASFAKYPICTDLDQLDDADVCVMGIPYDMGAPYPVSYTHLTLPTTPYV